MLFHLMLELRWGHLGNFLCIYIYNINMRAYSVTKDVMQIINLLP